MTYTGRSFASLLALNACVRQRLLLSAVKTSTASFFHVLEILAIKLAWRLLVLDCSCNSE